MPKVGEINHHVIVVDLDNGKSFAIGQITDQQLQALSDCECYTIVDPLLNTQWNSEVQQWEPIKIGAISQDQSIVFVREKP